MADISANVRAQTSATSDDPERNLGLKSSRRERQLATAYLAFQALGSIYGDIGTSPLYTFSSIFTSPPVSEDVLGAASSIFWSFTIICIIKYGGFVFHYGVNGEQGGTVAIYAKLARQLKLDKVAAAMGDNVPGGISNDLLLLSRTSTKSSWLSVDRNFGSKISQLYHYTQKKFLAIVPITLCFFGCSLTFADGLLTPTTSVLSAIGGIAVAAPHVTHYVVVISCIILALLYLFQRLGSAKISFVFAPVILIWFICLIVIGIVNILHHPAVFKALSPVFAIRYLQKVGIDGLSGVILALTGAEAMFADVGHFSTRAVNISLVTIVYPALMLTYLGQAARLVEDPSLYSNTFYLTIPGQVGDGFYWFMFVLSTIATVIASQAVILSAFSLYMQLDNLDCVPKLRIVHLSDKIYGKVYVPILNWALMILVILTTIGYQNSNAVTNAYGLCVSLVFATTTFMLSLCMCMVGNVHWLFAVFFLLVFGSLDMAFVVAELRKFIHGAWFPFMISMILTILMFFWHWGRTTKLKYDYDSRVPISTIFKSASPLRSVPISTKISSTSEVASVNDGEELAEIGSSQDRNVTIETLPTRDRKYTTLPGMAIFYSDNYFTLNSPNTVPGLFHRFVESMSAIHEKVVFMAIRYTGDPYVPPEERIHVSPVVKVPGLYRAVALYGFNERPSIDKEFVSELYSHLYESLEEILGETERGGFDPVRVDEQDYHDSNHVVHFFGFEKVSSKPIDISESWPKRAAAWIRMVLIDYLFSPVDSAVGAPNLRYEVESDNVFLIERLIKI